MFINKSRDDPVTSKKQEIFIMLIMLITIEIRIKKGEKGNDDFKFGW